MNLKQLLASLERKTRFCLQFLASPRCLQMNVSCEANKVELFACFPWKLNSKDQERIKPNETPETQEMTTTTAGPQQQQNHKTARKLKTEETPKMWTHRRWYF
jgi:hypothetical protein